jgi:hypothetical protein
MLRKTLLTIAVGAAALAFATSSSKADVIFGTQTPGAGCVAASNVSGAFVCTNPQVYTDAGGSVLTANGFSGAPATSTPTALTTKTQPTFTGGEDGLGENAVPPPPACSDPDCEIGDSHSVTVTDSTTAITDAIIGSVQAGESFNFFIQTTAGGPFAQLGSTLTNACNTAPGFSVGPAADECTWVAPPGGRTGIAVEAVAGNVTLVEASTSTITTTPEPATLALLGTALVGFAVIRRRRR